MTKTGAQILWECLEREGVKHVFGYPGGAILPAYDACSKLPRYPPHPGTPRAGRHAHGGWLCARQRRGRRGDRHFGAGRHEHGDRHRHGHAGFVSHRLHHRTSGQQADRLRRLSGNRHHRHHAADHQAQLSGHTRRGIGAVPCAKLFISRTPAVPARCWSTSPKTRNSRPASSTGTPPQPQLPGYRPDLSS